FIFVLFLVVRFVRLRRLSLHQKQLVGNLTGDGQAGRIGLSILCQVANNEIEFIQMIDEIKNTEFSETHIANRKNVLEKFTNKNNGKELIKILEAL
ncbi:MAG: hypothetical protein HQ522_02020, partial [Bacteroidetes bacterium]|nr:hypothetical protein [Bacteroidota bacterium]